MMMNRSNLLFWLSTVALLDACSAFQSEALKRTFVGVEQPRARRAVVLLATSAEGTAATTGPRGEARQQQRRRRQEGRGRRHAQRRTSSQGNEPRSKCLSIPFDGKILSSEQTPNEQAPPFDLFGHIENESSSIRCMSDFQDGETLMKGSEVSQPAFEFLSLDDLTFCNNNNNRYKLPGFSKRFNADAQFRQSLRQAMREDIYDTTPQYENLSAKAKEVLLLPDSSLQGSWRKPNTIADVEIRMKRLTKVLQDAFAVHDDDDDDDENKENKEPRFCPTGDDLMQAIGDLCGPKPSTHWIDIVGVLDRTIPHSWHQDTGRSASNIKTVLWGFPVDNDYTGCGVFSHVVSLQHESKAPYSHPQMQPILFDGVLDNDYIVRPCYGPGRELLIYRDVDVLHSSPDVAYRTSVMRFM